MLPGPYVVRACPECDRPFIETTIRSGNTFGAKFWSDGKTEAPMMPLNHRLVLCPECFHYLWIEKAKPLDSIEYDEMSKSQYKDAKFFLEPESADLIEALKESDLTSENEKYLRQRLLWRLNDLHRGRQNQSDLQNIEQENRSKLLRLIKDEGVEGARLFKAEILREMGEFKAALNLLNTESEDKNEWIEQKLQELCKAGISDVVILKD